MCHRQWIYHFLLACPWKCILLPKERQCFDDMQHTLKCCQVENKGGRRGDGVEAQVADAQSVPPSEWVTSGRTFRHPGTWVTRTEAQALTDREETSPLRWKLEKRQCTKKVTRLLFLIDASSWNWCKNAIRDGGRLVSNSEDWCQIVSCASHLHFPNRSSQTKTSSQAAPCVAQTEILKQDLFYQIHPILQWPLSLSVNLCFKWRFVSICEKWWHSSGFKFILIVILHFYLWTVVTEVIFVSMLHHLMMISQLSYHQRWSSFQRSWTRTSHRSGGNSTYLMKGQDADHFYRKMRLTLSNCLLKYKKGYNEKQTSRWTL